MMETHILPEREHKEFDHSNSPIPLATHFRKTYLPLFIAIISIISSPAFATDYDQDIQQNVKSSVIVPQESQPNQLKYNQEHEKTIQGFIDMVNHGGKILQCQDLNSIHYEIYNKSNKIVAIIRPLVDLDPQNQMAVKVEYELTTNPDDTEQRKVLVILPDLPSLQKLIGKAQFFDSDFNFHFDIYRNGKF